MSLSITQPSVNVECTGVYAPGSGTVFDPSTDTWTHDRSEPPALVDRRAGKVKSNEPELWLRLVQTPKLIDQMALALGVSRRAGEVQARGGNGRRSAPRSRRGPRAIALGGRHHGGKHARRYGLMGFLGASSMGIPARSAKQTCPTACRGSRASRYVSAELVAAAVCDPPNPFRMVKTASSSTARLS